MSEPAETALKIQNIASTCDPSSDRSAQDGVQIPSAYCATDIETLHHKLPTENKHQEAVNKTGGGAKETTAVTIATIAVSEEQLVREVLIDEDNDDKTSDDRLASQLDDIIYRRQIRYEDARELISRKKKSSRLAIQSNLYTQLIEDRLKELETQVDILRNLPPTGADLEIDQSMNPLPHHASVKHMSWSAFSATAEIPKSMLDRNVWIHGLEIDSTQRSVIEILIEEPRRGTQGWGNRNDTDIDPSLYVPWRLRLRTPLLLKLLERITKQKVTIGAHKHKLVLLRPFKLLVAYADQIFSFTKELEEKLFAKSVNSEADKLENASSDDIKASNHNELQEKQDTHLDDGIETLEALKEMRLLEQILTNDLGPTVELRQGVENGTVGKVSFGDLWHVFRYGQEVRSQGAKQVQLYRVLRITGGRSLHTAFMDRESPTNVASIKLKDDGYSKEAFVLDCVYFDFNGTQFSPISKTFIIRRFEGEKDITSLPAYPLILDPSHSKLREDLLKRGDKFASLSNPSIPAHMQYQGLTLDQQPEQIESQIIIDFKLAFLAVPDYQPIIAPISLVEHDIRETRAEEVSMCKQCTTPGCCGNDIVFPDYEVDRYFEELLLQNDKHFLDTVDNAADLDDNQKVLLPCRVYGFALRSRKWATFDIDRVKEVEYADGWENLVIKPNVKETVLALVKNHARQPQHGTDPEGALSSVDLVRGKGKGLIILLHGEPGVGKTSTAECVADHTRRPLFPITCGDIGDTAESVEENLERNFQLAHKWGCVLLLDEADVFLSRRTSSDLTRNAIVSVFLRTLEYYSGILFLTTNRVGNIDRAFKSRIHVALYYPKLDKTTTYEIWKRNIKRIKADFKREKKDFVIQKEPILKFSKEHFRELKAAKFPNWNGRQIRNAFQTAIALAEYDAKSGEKPVLGAKQFAAVALASREFDLYLKETQRGKDDAQLAQEEKSRTDNWGDYNRDSGFIEQGVVYVPQAARAQHPNGLSPTVARRSNKPGPGNKQQTKGEISDDDDDDLTDDTSSVTDEDEEDSEANISPHSGNSDNEAVGSSEHEEEETDEGEKEADEPISPAKPVKIKAKKTSKDKSKASSSKNSERLNNYEENDDGEIDHKAKKKGKGLSSKSHKI